MVDCLVLFKFLELESLSLPSTNLLACFGEAKGFLVDLHGTNSPDFRRAVLSRRWYARVVNCDYFSFHGLKEPKNKPPYMLNGTFW